MIFTKPGWNLDIKVSYLKTIAENTKRKPCKAYTTDEWVRCSLQRLVASCNEKKLIPSFIPQIHDNLSLPIAGWLSEHDYEKGCLMSITTRKTVSACTMPCVLIQEKAVVVQRRGKAVNGTAEIVVSMLNPTWSTEQRQVREITATMLVSSIGGTLALWTGVSLVAMAHAGMAVLPAARSG